MYNFECSTCRTKWDGGSSPSACPTCGASCNAIAATETDATQDEIKKVFESQSELARDVAEAQAHLAVGIAGLTKIINRIESQRSNLIQEAKRYIGIGRLSNFNMEKFMKFLDDPIKVCKINGIYRIISPTFIEVEIEGALIVDDGSFVKTGYQTHIIEDPPQWIIDLRNKQEAEFQEKPDEDNSK